MQPPGGNDSSTDQASFLSTLSRGCPPGLHFLVSLKTEDRGYPSWTWNGEPLPPGPWYFYTGASDKPRRRQAEDTKAVRCIVIDDVGTKVDATAIKAKPTWVLETSRGNFQWGFMLREWTDRIPAANALMAGIVAAGIQDTSVSTACRLFRVPGSVNDKPGKDGFEAELICFDKDIVYTLTSLAKALKVKPGKVSRPRERPAVPPAAGEPDPIFNWLIDNGHMLDQQNSAGWWPILCPFAGEHSDGRREAKYLHRADSDVGMGQVWCEHNHGQGPMRGLYTQRFFQWVENESGLVRQGPPERPEPDWSILKLVLGITPKPAPSPACAAFMAQQTEPAPAEPYDFITLRQDIGNIDIGKLANLELTAAGAPKAIQPTSAENVQSGLQLLGVHPRLNLMTAGTSYIPPERIDLERFGHKADYEISDMLSRSLRDVFGRARMKNKEDLADCIAGIANSQFWHPMQDWILAKPWDGRDRFEQLCKSIPTPTPDLFRMYFRRWLLQGVEACCGWSIGRRKSQKGMVLVLVGRQRIGKTRWFASLAPDFSCIGKHLNLSSRDSIHECLQGVIVELGELDATFKRSDIAALKAFITTETDEYRLPYASGWLRRPRCASFCGTVNDPKFLNDPTGNGRFLPIEVDGKIDVDHATDMQQLWAQVHTWWRAKEQWWLTEEEEQLRDEAVPIFEAINPVAEVIEESLHQRQDTDKFPVEVIVGPRHILELCNKDSGHPKHLGTAGTTLTRLLGKGKDLTQRGSPTKQDRWIINVNEVEMSVHKLYPAKPIRA